MVGTEYAAEAVDCKNISDYLCVEEFVLACLIYFDFDAYLITCSRRLSRSPLRPCTNISRALSLYVCFSIPIDSCPISKQDSFLIIRANESKLPDRSSERYYCPELTKSFHVPV